MKISCKPILYSRTYNVDFRGRLLGMPDDWSENEHNEIYNLIIQSTYHLEMSRGKDRVIVYGNGRYIIFGKVVDFRAKYNKLGRNALYGTVDKIDGRQNWGFLGVSVNIENCLYPFDISDNVFMDLYEQTIKNRWNDKEEEKSYRTDTFSEIEIEIEKLDDNIIEINDNSAPIIMEEKNNKSVIFTVFNKAINGENISLCTSLFDLPVNVNFDIVTSDCPIDDKKNKNDNDTDNRFSNFGNEYRRMTENTKINKDFSYMNNNKKPSYLEEMDSLINEHGKNARFKNSFNEDVITDIDDEEKVADIVKTASLGTGVLLGIFAIECFFHVAKIVIITTVLGGTIIVGGLTAKKIYDRMKKNKNVNSFDKKYNDFDSEPKKKTENTNINMEFSKMSKNKKLSYLDEMDSLINEHKKNARFKSSYEDVITDIDDEEKVADIVKTSLLGTGVFLGIFAIECFFHVAKIVVITTVLGGTIIVGGSTAKKIYDRLKKRDNNNFRKKL